MKFTAVVFTLLLVFMITHGTSGAEDLPDGPSITSDLVAKIIEAHGGKRATDEMKGVHARGKTDAYMRQDSGTYELFFERPRRLRVETKYQKSFETRILNGLKGHRGTDRIPLSEVQDHRLLAMVYQYKHFDLPYGLMKGLYSITMLPSEQLNGKNVKVLLLTDNEGPPMDVYIDPETHLIVKVTGHFIVAEGVKTTLSSEFSDFKKAGGLMLPFRVTYFGGRQKIAETVFESYEINPSVPESVFLP